MFYLMISFVRIFVVFGLLFKLARSPSMNRSVSYDQRSDAALPEGLEVQMIFV